MRAAFIFLMILACALLVGIVEKSSPEVTAQIEREAYEEKITFTMPVEYTATVSQCNKDGCKTRYYFPRSK